jgi:L-Ala-D/L-Glu epimerase
MNRRNFVLAQAGWPRAAEPERRAAATVLEAKSRLNLRHTWTTTMSSSQYRDTLHVATRATASPATAKARPSCAITRRGRRAAGGGIRARLLLAADPMQFASDGGRFRRVEGAWAGKAAIDIALMDWVGQKLGVPLYSLFRTGPRREMCPSASGLMWGGQSWPQPPF